MSKEQNVASKDFLNLFSKANAKKAAEDIIDNFRDVNDEENSKVVEYDFKWNHGTLISDDVNTWFKFDTEKGTLLHKMMELLCDPEVEPTEANIQLFDEFRDHLKKYLEKDYKDLFLSKLRDQVLKLPANVVPLKSMEIKEIEITDKPDVDYTLVVEKNASESFNPGTFSYDILQEMQKTGEEPQEVVDRKVKENGGMENRDNMWAYIERAYKRKYLYEVQIDLYVDYSLAKESPIEIMGT